MCRIETIQYDSWEHCRSELLRQLFGQPRFVPGRFLFRGQARGDWGLTTSFDRWYARWGRARDRRRLSSDLVAAFLEACENQGLDQIAAMDKDRSLALAQHYGLPTRLLDWTESPYVAAFFAFQSYVQLEAGSTEVVALWALDRLAPIWASASEVQIIRPPRSGNVRLRNQSGFFTVSAFEQASLNEWLLSQPGDDIALYRLLVPSSSVTSAMTDLAAMHITPGSLFSDLEGAAATAVQRLALQSSPSA